MTSIDLNKIGVCDMLDQDYVKGLTEARLLADLIAITEHFAPLFPDAYEQAQNISDEDFLAWRRYLRKERQGQFAGDDFAIRFGNILLPENMLRIGEVACKFHVPFGLAFQRLIEAKAILVNNQKITWATR